MLTHERTAISPVHDPGSPGAWRHRLRAPALLCGLILAGVVRSSLATRFDGFTIDEPDHVTAGVAYARTGDYRLNPEHPPLMKLWVGEALPASVFRLPPFRVLRDKPDERDFTDDAVYLMNDPDTVRAVVRAAMLALNGLVLLAFGLAARRAFGDLLAVSAVSFLLIDPTVAAHMPVAMTDLPVALLATTSILLAAAAFRSWRTADLAVAALALGLTLGVKHSGLVALVFAGGLGAVMALRRTPEHHDSSGAGGPARSLVRVRWLASSVRRLALVAAVILGAVAVLWALYRFRFDESPEPGERFNRLLAVKIDDVASPVHAGTLRVLAGARLLPRAYLWGLADVVRAGIEGRGYGIFAFGSFHPGRKLAYFFPGVLAAKLPLGLMALAALGAVLLLARRTDVPRGPLYAALGFAALYLTVLAAGSSAYAGVRHALPLVPPLALLGGVSVAEALARETPKRPSRLLIGGVAVASLAALASALPVVRPWEYYNELAGGAANAYHYFSDEGIDLGQRTRDLARYWTEHLAPSGEVPYVDYMLSEAEATRRGIQARWWNSKEGEAGDASDTVSGTFLLSASFLAPYPWYDYAAFRAATPVARFGNLLVFRGTFNIPWMRARNLYYRALKAIDSPADDTASAERFLAEAVERYPQGYAAALELGNLLARRGARAEAIRAYEIAHSNAPPDDGVRALLERQIARVAAEPPESVPPLRDPWVE
jgi:tetratricopeptide (TPR) repeat protein